MLSSVEEEERYKLIKSQVESFQQKVKMCEDAYSTQLAESMFSQMLLADGAHVQTVYKLKHYAQTRPEHETNNPLLVYANWYIANLSYLKELKANFDERIYVILTKFYQQEELEEEVIESVPGSKEPSIMSDVRAQNSTSVLKFKNDLPEVKDLYDFTEVNNIAQRLRYLRQRWQLLLDDESEISPTLFSFNSRISTTPHCPTQIVYLLRLVPDILLKCRNAGLLALQWLEHASSKAIDAHTKYSKLERVKSILTEKLSGLSDEIKLEEKALEAESSDLELLAEREERANEIMSKTKRIDFHIEQLQSKIYQLNIDNNRVKHAIKSDVSNRQALNKQLYNNELEVLKLGKDIKLLQYEKTLLEEELAVELEVKPCMIRFTDQIQEKCETLEQTIDKKRQEKQTVESALIPVIADRNRAQAEMSRATSVTSSAAVKH